MSHSPNELQSELRRRLQDLEEPPHRTSECAESTRGILIEALIWILGGAATWVIAAQLL